MAKNPLTQQKNQALWYIRNKERILAKQRERRTMLQQVSNDCMVPCRDCGAFDIRFMDWHHRDPSTKIDAVAGLISDRKSIDDLVAEIHKCDCLCSNCHRIRHSK